MGVFDTHGGYFAPAGYTKVNTGGSHDENPNGGVQLGVDEQGIPNMLEEGEPVYNDYVFSDNIYADGGILEKHHLPKKLDGKLYSDIVEEFIDPERAIDAIANNGTNKMLVRLMEAQEEQKQREEQAELEKELASLSPEEQAELAQMLQQQEMAAQEGQEMPVDMGVPQQEVMPEEIAPEQVAPEVIGQPQQFKCGGPVNRFDMGNPIQIADETPFAVRDNTATPFMVDSGLRVTPPTAEELAARREREKELWSLIVGNDKEEIVLPDGTVSYINTGSVPLMSGIGRAARLAKGVENAAKAVAIINAGVLVADGIRRFAVPAYQNTAGSNSKNYVETAPDPFANTYAKGGLANYFDGKSRSRLTRRNYSRSATSDGIGQSNSIIPTKQNAYSYYTNNNNWGVTDYIWPLKKASMFDVYKDTKPSLGHRTYNNFISTVNGTGNSASTVNTSVGTVSPTKAESYSAINTPSVGQGSAALQAAAPSAAPVEQAPVTAIPYSNPFTQKLNDIVYGTPDIPGVRKPSYELLGVTSPDFSKNNASFEQANMLFNLQTGKPYTMDGLDIKLNPDLYPVTPVVDAGAQSGSEEEEEKEKETVPEFSYSPLSTSARYLAMLPTVAQLVHNLSQPEERIEVPNINPVLPEGRMNLVPLEYRSVDPNLFTTQLMHQNMAAQRGAMESGNLVSVPASVAAINDNATTAYGNAQAQAYDNALNRKNTVISGNNASEVQRAQYDASIRQARAGILNRTNELRAQYRMLAERLEMTNNMQEAQAISSQLNAISETLANLGRENFIMNQVNSNRALGYGTGASGMSFFKPSAFMDWIKGLSEGE